MAQYKVCFKASTREVQILDGAAATPAGFVSWGTFQHGDDSVDGHSFAHNHAVYHHVRHLAYKAGEQNMQTLSISYSGVSISPPT